VQLSRDDFEYIWNELVLYLHFILIAIFLFIAIYSWHINKKLAFIIVGADALFIISVLSNLVKRNKMSRNENPYCTENFSKHSTAFVKQFANMLETENKEDIIGQMSKNICNITNEAYERGFIHGKRK